MLVFVNNDNKSTNTIEEITKTDYNNSENTIKGLNLYAYCNNNLVMYTDPNGIAS